MQYKYLKPLSFLPALLLMYLIFHLSAQPAVISSDLSEGFTYTIAEFLSRLFLPSLTSQELTEIAVNLNGIIRKAAHFSEYLLLASTLSFSFYIYKISPRKLLIFSFLICIIYACTDEIHQYFVPGRACQFRDICIDSFGAGCSIATQFIFLKIKRLLH